VAISKAVLVMEEEAQEAVLVVEVDMVEVREGAVEVMEEVKEDAHQEVVLMVAATMVVAEGKEDAVVAREEKTKKK
jgi:hypothetical protein